MNVRHTYERELNELHHEMLKMGTLVEQTIEHAINAFIDNDIEMAKKIAAEDDLIDYFEKKIEHHCVILIARQQPLAKDLRAISSIMKMITDLERIGDHASDISNIVIKMDGANYRSNLCEIPEMAKIAKEMITGALDAYMKQDIELAKRVYFMDERVDSIYDRVVKKQILTMNSDPMMIEECVSMIQIAKYFEKIADHATNLCEWVYYMVKGVHVSLSDKKQSDNVPGNEMSNVSDSETDEE